jgi:hypothetical protein
MKQITTVGLISLDDDLGFSYHIAKIEYRISEDDSFVYTFEPDYSVIDMLSSDLFQGIPGLDLDLRKPRYVRENVIPVFISERAPSENREDLMQLLENCGMKYLNPLEWLIRTNTLYGGDRLYVRRWEALFEKNIIRFSLIEQQQKRSVETIRDTLREICAGNDIEGDDFAIDDSNRSGYYALLMRLYIKEKTFLSQQRAKGIKASAERGNYRGRKPTPIDDTKLYEVLSAYLHHKMTAEQASRKLGLSRSTFFRKLRESKSKEL